MHESFRAAKHSEALWLASLFAALTSWTSHAYPELWSTLRRQPNRSAYSPDIPGFSASDCKPALACFAADAARAATTLEDRATAAANACFFAQESASWLTTSSSSGVTQQHTDEWQTLLINEAESDLISIDAREELYLQPLWRYSAPSLAEEAVKSLSRYAQFSGSHWYIWNDWYAKLLDGMGRFETRIHSGWRRGYATAIVQITNEDWKQGPDHVNAKIKAIIERETERGQTPSLSGGRSDHPPTEPDPGPGPNYSIQEGQLHLDPSPPIPSDEASSAALLPLLQGATADLQQLCQKLDNTHPRLAEAVRNYAATLDVPFEGLSVPSVWAYGGLLAELRQGFEAQSPSTMTEALEPEVSAQLANVVRQHAAFILGTEQGRDLVERADRFQQAPQTIEEIREHAEEILDELSDNEDLVDAETRAAHAPIRDHLRTIEWGACRTSYAGYLIVRKATFAMLRLVVGKEVSFISLLGATAAAGAIAGDPNLEFLRVALPVLRDHASAILAFYKHSPELRSYAEYALDLIDAAEEKLDPRVKPEDDT